MSKKGIEMTAGRPKVSPEIKWPDVIGDVRVDLSRVYSKIDSTAGPQACWTWHGPRHRQGYGMIGGQRIATGEKLMMTVHRLLLKEKLGRDPGPTVDAMHTCGNMRCVNPAHIVPGNAEQILNLRIQRTGQRFGKPPGYKHHKPRNQNYTYGIDNILALANGQLSIEDFAARTNTTYAQAKKIKWNIDNGQSYSWAKTWKGN